MKPRVAHNRNPAKNGAQISKISVIFYDKNLHCLEARILPNQFCLNLAKIIFELLKPIRGVGGSAILKNRRAKISA